jgi:hypothetical protein
MLHILGTGKKLCDGITRRELMRVGGLSLFGDLSWSDYLRTADRNSARTRQDARSHGKARSVIFFNLLGGPSHLDMFDLKPDAPAEIRGEFRPIATSLPGLRITEHLPETAKWMNRSTLIRTVTHTQNAHDPLVIMTGFVSGDFNQNGPKPTDPPDIGAVCQYLGRGPRDMPGAVCLPCFPGWGQMGWRRPGPYGGFLGNQYDPLFSVCAPTFARKPRVPNYDPVPPLGDPQAPSLTLPPDVTAQRLDSRLSLLQQFDRHCKLAETSRAMERLDKYQQQALSMSVSSRTRDAFDLSREPDRVRERYGRNLHASSLLVARRLVEAGVPFVSVHAEIFGDNGHSYDTHENNFGMLKDVNLPILDQAYPALVQDLDERGLLDSTLVVVMGEMGRTPRVENKAGRGHWPQCGFSLLTGGGIRPGTVFGTSDKTGAYPKDNPVAPADIVATIYDLLGIDPHMQVTDRTGRPVSIMPHEGQPLRGIMV